MHRLTQKGYSDGTPGAVYYYDENDPFGFSVANPVGRLVAEWTGNGTWAVWKAFTYDPVGRIVGQRECVPPPVGSAQCQAYTINQTYDLLGDMTSYTNGQNVTFTQTFNAAAQLTQLTSSYIDSQHPGTLAVFNNYSPIGAVTNMSYGNGLTETAVFNNRLQPCRVNANSSGTALSTCTAAVPSGNLLDLTYNWNAGTSDNGNVMGWTAAGNQTFNRSFTYDALNRVGSMSDSDSVATCQGLTWGYDAWGNRTAQTPTKGTCGSWSVSYSANNQIGGYTYDAAGNVLNDGMHSYSYDAENRITQVDGTPGNCSTATACYIYGADGLRAQKTVGSVITSYTHDAAGRVIAELQNSAWQVGYVYAGGLAAIYTNSTTYFIHPDHLGSTRLMTAMNQSVYDSMDYLPFGEQIAGSTGTTHKFTVYERDSESGLDDAMFRYNSSRQGRFMSPDPYNFGANPANPQSWNAYAYVLNNPLSLTDPTGKGPGLASDCQAEYQSCGTADGGAAEIVAGGGGGGGGMTFGCDEFDTIDPNSFCSQIMLPIVNGTFTLANWNNYYPPQVEYQFSGGNGSILEQQEEAAAIQLGELQCAGEDSSAIGDCIQQAYDTLQPAQDPNGNPQLEGGNYDFEIASVQINGQGINPSSFGCFESRCGAFDSLDFSHNDGTFHVDTANVWSMLGFGAIVHLGFDLVGGNTWWKNNGIPRPWW